MRKKRLCKRIALVVIVAVFFVIIAILWMKKDKEEYIKWQAQYKGVWVSPDENYEMTVMRVTSAHIIFSVQNKKSDLALDYASAEAVGDGEYNFQYQLQKSTKGKISANYGNMCKGTISLKEQGLVLEVPAFEKFKNCLEFHGALKKKSGLPSVKRTDLQTLMGGKAKDHDEDKNCYVVEEDKGKINRIHIRWDSKQDREGYEKYEMAGINPICFASDLQTQFGSPIEEEELDENRYKRVYEKDGFRYQFITEGYGLVAEGDCQYEVPEHCHREGDFVMKGDTVLRYLGDYEKSRTISLPRGTKKIASGAFTVTPNIISDNLIRTIKLSIPNGVQVEKEAFRECGRMKITLEEGWKSVPKEAFANMVVMNRSEGRSNWVEVILPRSLRRLEEKAFETNWYEDRFEISTMDSINEQPVKVQLTDELEYIGDNALKGISNRLLPAKIKHLGQNFVLFCDVLEMKQYENWGADGRWYCNSASKIIFPEQLEEIAENALSIDYNDTAIITLPEKCNNYSFVSKDMRIVQYEVEGGNKTYCEKDGWLFSKDGKVLYRTTCNVNYIEGQKGRKIEYHYNPAKKEVDTHIHIAEGVEEIAEHAFSEVMDFHDYTIMELQYVTPKSLKRMDCNVLFEQGMGSFGYGYTIKISGEVPVFSGKFSANTKFKRKIYVKRQNREKFIKALLKEQTLTDKQTSQLKKCIVGY